MGYCGGLIGFPPDSRQLDDARKIAADQSVDIRFVVDDVPTRHPNTYLIEAQSHSGRGISMEAVSLGGGAIEIWQLTGIKVCLAGDLFLTVFHNLNNQPELQGIAENIVYEQGARIVRLNHYTHPDKNNSLIIIESRHPLSETCVSELTAALNSEFQARVRPVMPVLSGAGKQLPFTSAEEMLAYGNDQMNLVELAYHYEKARSGFSREQLHDLMGGGGRSVPGSAKHIGTGLRYGGGPGGIPLPRA